MVNHFTDAIHQGARTMLCLTRYVGEAIRIGDALVTVLEIRGNRVRLGIQAPSSIRIMRTEIEDTHETTGPLPPLRKLRLAGAA